MDKLEPIIKQRFWILLGLCLVLGIFGFFKGQSSLVSATEAREKVLDDKKSGISTGIREPNDQYTEKLKKINDEYAQEIASAVKSLSAEQQARMWWPPIVRGEIPKDYRDTIGATTARKYATVYSPPADQIISDLWKKVEPVVPKAVPGQAAATNDVQYSGSVTWTPKVYCDRSSLPQKLLGTVPDSDAIWDAQEDVWFVELIFDAIRNINSPADSPQTAIVRKVNTLQLVGGSGHPEGADGTTASTTDAFAGMKSMRAPEGTLNAFGGGVGGGAEMSAPIAFDPAEEFGSDAVTASADAGGDTTGNPTAAMSIRGFGGGMGNDRGLRWIGKDDSAPFRERGFYLSVTIMQSQLPDFLIELTNAAWPIRIVRFQMGPNPDYREMSGEDLASPYGDELMAPTGRTGGSSSAAQMRGRTGGMLGGAGLGGRGTVGAATGTGLNFINTATDPFAGSLSVPDLVQVDIAGIITFYIPPKSDGTAVKTPDVDSPVIEPPAIDEKVSQPAAEDKQAPAPGDAPEKSAPPPDGAAPAEGEKPNPDNSPPAAESPPIEPAAGEAAPAASDAAPPESNAEAPNVPDSPPPAN